MYCNCRFDVFMNCREQIFTGKGGFGAGEYGRMWLQNSVIARTLMETRDCIFGFEAFAIYAFLMRFLWDTYSRSFMDLVIISGKYDCNKQFQLGIQLVSIQYALNILQLSKLHLVFCIFFII